MFQRGFTFVPERFDMFDYNRAEPQSVTLVIVQIACHTKCENQQNHNINLHIEEVITTTGDLKITHYSLLVLFAPVDQDLNYVQVIFKKKTTNKKQCKDRSKIT